MCSTLYDDAGKPLFNLMGQKILIELYYLVY